MTQRPPSPGGSQNTPAKSRLSEMLRVDHAGEYAAVTIYAAQKKVFSASAKTRAISKQTDHMLAEEQKHLAEFDDLLREHNTRPTALLPLWHALSHGLGVATALMGEKAAHACTEAVESVIEAHYAEQISETETSHPELSRKFAKFREDELAHRDLAVAEGAHDTPGYPLLSALIKTGCRAAIKISEKI